ncbi:MAG: glycosyltransferase, partial [Acidimicrobiales bacterium]|nr:glycosyltransferase [Acidimicrobiales bacterium]
MIPSVSVVVLNWNSGPLGAEAARSVLAQSHPKVELVVVDNGSDDDSLAKIKAVAPEAVYVQLATNRGFAAGMNAGIAANRSDFVVPLNCDATLDPDFVRSALAVHWAHPQTAIVGAKVRSADHVSGPLDLTWTMRVAFRDTDRLTTCHKADGSCPVMRRAALDQVIETFGSGPYDESYDTYGEDLD